MLHEPAAQSGKDPAFAFKRKLGVRLCLIYALIYGLFIAINIINPKSMEVIVFSGLNLAVVYGFGLIIFALLLALAYSSVCSKHENKLSTSGEA